LGYRNVSNYNDLVVLPILLASGLLAAPYEGVPDPWYRRLRAKYDEFARKLERGDPSFLRFVDPEFVYIGPDGRRLSAKAWSDGMRVACRENHDARVSFRITEIRRQKDRVLVSYVWSYHYRPGSRRSPLPRRSESISTDTWRLDGNDLRLLISKDFRLWHRTAQRDAR
jgi:hypothetical protein